MKIFEVTEKLYNGKKNCGCNQDPCKTYGLQEGDRADGARTAQAMKRAGMDVDNTTFNKTANQNFSGTDAVDQISLKGRKADQKRQDDIEARLDKQEKERQQRSREEKRHRDNAKARERSKQERQDRKDAAQGAEDGRGGKIQGKVDKNKGYRKSADGRTLRDPRYYKDDPGGKGRPQGAIGKGLDRLRADPGYVVSKYYNDKVNQVKDFLNQRI